MMVLSLAYLMFGLFSGQLVRIEPTAAAQAQAFNAARIVLSAFQYSAIVFFLSILLLAWESKDAAMVHVVGAVVCYFVLPYFVLPFAGLTAGPIYRLLNNGFMVTGLLVGVMAIVRYTVALVEYFIALLRGEAKLPLGVRGEVGVADHAPVRERLSHKPSVFSPCWELPFCRETIRKICPAYLARKKCWKFGKGCYCDQEMITRIITGEVGAHTASARAFARETITTDLGLDTAKRSKPPCGKCYIYLYHQQLKHRLLSPLLLPATIGLVVLLKPAFDYAYAACARLGATFWQTISFTKTPPPPARAPTPFDMALQGLVLFLFGFFLLILLTKALEFCIYKLKL
ncbi:MAG: hypothetical protein NZT92_04690 [Abditibacteriales bacterium]|nr:hypothetical protein [Abditibacteriales bacterium]MDW8365238.1 hypothetical protein [Abditibacteriales bacterium]